MNLNKEDHESLALWAADCAEHVLPHFEEECPKDDRPRKAVEVTRSWTDDKMTVSEARDVSFAAHTAARDANQTAAREAARAAGHAAATAHVDDHAPHAATYSVKAATAAAPTDDTATIEERDWQFRRLPKHLRSVVFPDRSDG